MTEFFLLNSRALLPFFVLIGQTGLILPRWGLILPRIPLPTLVLYPAGTHPFRGFITPPASHQSTPFPDLNLKVGKKNYGLGNLDPSGQYVRKVNKTFLEVGKKKLFI